MNHFLLTSSFLPLRAHRLHARGLSLSALSALAAGRAAGINKAAHMWRQARRTRPELACSPTRKRKEGGKEEEGRDATVGRPAAGVVDGNEKFLKIINTADDFPREYQKKSNAFLICYYRLLI